MASALGRVGNFMSGVGAVGTTIKVTLNYRPSAIILFTIGDTGQVDAVASKSAFTAIGAATGAANQGCIATQSPDGSSLASAGGENWMDDAVMATMLDNNAAQTIDGKLAVQTIDSDGFTLVVTDQFATSRCIGYLALGGAVNKAYLGKLQPSGSTGNQSVTGLGFTPKAIISFVTYNSYLADGSNARGALTIGMMVSPTQRGVSGFATGRSNVAAEQGDKYSYAGEGVAQVLWNSLGVQARANLVSWDADGFTINWLEAGNNTNRHFFLALGGDDAQFAVASMLTQTDTVTPIVVSGLPFKPVAGLFISHQEAASTQDVSTTDGKLSIGAFGNGSPNERMAVGVFTEDGTNPNDINVIQEMDAIFAAPTNAGAIDALMDLVTVNADGISAIMDDADGAQALVNGLFIGPAPSEANMLVMFDFP